MRTSDIGSKLSVKLMGSQHRRGSVPPDDQSEVETSMRQRESAGKELVEEEQKVIKPARNLKPHEKRFFDDLTDEEFVTYIDSLRIEEKHIILENRVFENFLLANEPSLIAGLPQAHQAIEELEKTQPIMPLGLENTDIETPTLTPKSIMFSEKGNRINLSQRTDLVLRDVEEMQLNLNAFIEKSHKTKFRLRAEVEEASIRGDEIIEARNLFEQGTVIDAVDSITQRIPAEKFTWYMAEWLKSARLVTEKMRLRNCSLKIQYMKLKAQLAQKIELGESISEVDFEQLHIENKNLLKKIEKMNTHLMQLKQITGKANLNLATHKKYLQKILNGLKTLKRAIDETIDQTKEHERQCAIAEKEVAEANQQYNEVKELIENFKVPEVLDYLKVKAHLHNLKKTLKVLNRKQNIVKIIMGSSVKQMMTLKNQKKPHGTWFKKSFHVDYFEHYVDEDEDKERRSHLVKNMVPEFDILTVLKKPPKRNK